MGNLNRKRRRLFRIRCDGRGHGAGLVAGGRVGCILDRGSAWRVTMFSAFALDISILHERGEMLQAILYVTVSVAGSIAAIIAGMSLTRAVLQ